jgi:putative ABC transport system substrate-binding protein
MKLTIERQRSWARTNAFTLALLLFAAVHNALGADAAARAARIGFLSPSEPPSSMDTVRQRLTELGYVEGKNAVSEFRYSHGKPDRLPELAADLVRLKVDVIVAQTNAAAFAARDATRMIPIVVWASHGASDTGLVASLGRPGGNITGLESLAPELDAKRVELLKEVVPHLSQLGMVCNAEDRGAPLHVKWTGAAASALGITTWRLEVRRAEDYDAVLSAAAGKHLDGLLTFTDPLTFDQWNRVAAFALVNRVPTICEFKELAQVGCMLSYGATFAEFSERVAKLVDRILKGAKPADLPMEQATRFELAVNLKTAKALGVMVPKAILVRADHVID